MRVTKAWPFFISDPKWEDAMANENDRPLGRFAELFDKYFTSKADWSVSDIKTQARSYFLTNLVSCLLVSLVLGTATRWMCYIFTPQSGFFDANMWENFLKTRLIALAIVGVIAFFAFGPLEMSAKRFYLLNEQGNKPGFGELKFGFKNGKYGNTILVMGVKNLICGLGYLLLIVPGLYFHYTYFMVPYLLAEQPGISVSDAMTMSRDMMKDNKWDAFLLDLSFWPWILASLLTGGLAGAVYGWPFRHSAHAELYLTILNSRYTVR